MSQLDDLLTRSRSPGKFVERRRFTLSREKAIEKQREFALRHPRQYILELVQSAVFAGATYIAIDVRPHSCLLAWVGGRKIEARELENLLDYLFADRSDKRHRHLVQLAVGVNAILQRKPRTLRIETGDGSTAVRMDLDSKGTGSVGIPEDAIGGTYLYAEFASGWMSRFATTITGTKHTTEQELVEERCLYTPVPILLNGGAPFGYRGSRHIEIFGARTQRHFDQDGRRGVVAIHSSARAPTGFRVVVGGVWISTLGMEEVATRPLVGVVCDDQLRKTADHSDIVQDFRYQQMLHGVQPHASALMREVEGARYQAPKLAVVDVPQEIETGAGPKIIAEPLPAALEMLHPRIPTSVERLQEVRVREAGTETPLFYCTPETVPEFAGAPADPSRFPYRLLVLTAGQAATLETTIPDVTLHRLSSKADIDFVRRVLERQVRVREYVISKDRGIIRIRLHLEGRLPDWGDGRRGLPFAIVRDGITQSAGMVDRKRVTLTCFEGGMIDRENEASYRLGISIRLPRISVVVEPTAQGWRSMNDEIVALILDNAWHLAVPDGDEPHAPLLCALLGQLAVPQLQSAPDVRLGASLPVRHPDSLRHVPLVRTDRGPLSLASYLDLLGTDEVVEVRSAAELAQLESLEYRFGFGHLTHSTVEARPVFGVGRIGERWVWMEEPHMWTLPTVTQLIWVASTFRPRTSDEHWEQHASPSPELVAVFRRDTHHSDWDAGWKLLLRQLIRLEIDDSWGRATQPPISVDRARGMGRLALLRLSVMLEKTDEPILLPSDGGARRSIDELRESPYARVIARHGVEMAEAWTFLLTRDELAVVAGETDIQLRYDDPPDVWRSLTDGPDTGWLIRQEVKQAGLSGWLGLRFPYDGTTGILVRTTGRLIAIPQMDRRIPCHGLLWPESSGGETTDEQVRLLQLAGLRLYQEILGRLRTGLPDDEAESARLYGWTFAKYASRNRKLSGTALDFARLIEVKDAEGQIWGSLEEWLDRPPGDRPAPPTALVVIDDPEPSNELVHVPDEHNATAYEKRLVDAMGIDNFKVRVVYDDLGNLPAVNVVESRSTRESVTLALNHARPIVKVATAKPGQARELLLLEMARQICLFTGAMGLAVDLLKCQQVLLAQRLETD